jgi:hypothetical protein
MKLGLEKLLQNIELKLRGRTAIFAIGQGGMVIALWLLLRDYAAHSVFSMIGGTALLIGILGFLALGLSGKARPDEVPVKSFTHIEQLGISIVQGVGSHRDMVQIMREVGGMRKLPAPSHLVRGSASSERNYVSLTPEQSNSIVEQIEQGVEKLLGDAIQAATGQKEQPQLQESGSEKAVDSVLIKGKSILP